MSPSSENQLLITLSEISDNLADIRDALRQLVKRTEPAKTDVTRLLEGNPVATSYKYAYDEHPWSN